MFDPHPKDERAIVFAKRLCWSCEARLDCLRDAIADPTSVGIRGGLTEDERKAIRRNRKIKRRL